MLMLGLRLSHCSKTSIPWAPRESFKASVECFQVALSLVREFSFKRPTPARQRLPEEFEASRHTGSYSVGAIHHFSYRVWSLNRISRPTIPKIEL